MKRVFAHIGFSFGISMLVLNIIKSQSIGICLTAGLAILLIASLVIKKYRQALAVPLCLGAAVFACIIFMFSYQNVVLPEQSLDNQSAYCEFYVTSLPQTNGEGYSYTVKTRAIYLENAPQNIKLKLNTDTRLNCESYQIIKGELKFSKIGDTAFESYGYWGKNIFLSSKAKKLEITDEHVKSLNKHVLKTRQNMISSLRAVPGDEGALARALTIGDKSDISFKLYNDFRISGAAHLMAISGLHLTAVSSFLLFLLEKLRVKDKLSFIITITAITYYCAICGFSKSVTRAGIMMTVLMLGKLFKKHSDPLNSLGLAVFIICINPFAVCDVGAVLSVLCVLSLCTAFDYISPKIKHMKLTKNRKLNNAALRILNGIAAAGCVLLYSICAYYLFFGYASLTSIFSGIILIPLGSIATVLSLLTSFAVRAKIGIPFIILTRCFNRFIITLVGLFAKIRFTLISFENYFGLVAALILIIFALCFIIDTKYLKAVSKISLVILAGLIISMAFVNKTCSYIYLTDDGAAALSSQGCAVVYGVDSSDDYFAIRKYLSSRKDKLELIAAPEENKFCRMLAEDFSCERLVFENTKTEIAPDFSVYLKSDGKDSSFTADIKGISFTENGEEKDITVYKKICKDKNGFIDLNDGDIIYRLSDKNYSARRFSVWEE